MRNIKKDRARCERATKGPWWTERIVVENAQGIERDFVWILAKDLGEEADAKVTISGVRQDMIAVDETQARLLMSLGVLVTNEETAAVEDEANAAFIAEARTALPYYIDRCEKQQRMLDEACEELAQQDRCPWDRLTMEFLTEDKPQRNGCTASIEECNDKRAKCWAEYLDQIAKG